MVEARRSVGKNFKLKPGEFEGVENWEVKGSKLDEPKVNDECYVGSRDASVFRLRHLLSEWANGEQI